MGFRMLDVIDNRHYGVSGTSTNKPTKPGQKVRWLGTECWDGNRYAGNGYTNQRMVIDTQNI